MYFTVWGTVWISAAVDSAAVYLQISKSSLWTQKLQPLSSLTKVWADIKLILIDGKTISLKGTLDEWEATGAQTSMWVYEWVRLPHIHLYNECEMVRKSHLNLLFRFSFYSVILYIGASMCFLSYIYVPTIFLFQNKFLP